MHFRYNRILIAPDPVHQVSSDLSPCERRPRWPTAAAPPPLTASETYLQEDQQTLTASWAKSPQGNAHSGHTVTPPTHKSLTSHCDQLLHCKLLPSGVEQVAVSHQLHVLEERARGGALTAVILESEEAAALQVYLSQWVHTLELMQNFLKTIRRKMWMGFTCMYVM